MSLGNLILKYLSQFGVDNQPRNIIDLLLKEKPIPTAKSIIDEIDKMCRLGYLKSNPTTYSFMKKLEDQKEIKVILSPVGFDYWESIKQFH